MQLFENPDLAWCDISGTLVFLDIARDRYFCLPEPVNSQALAYLDQVGNRSRQPAFCCHDPGLAAPHAPSSGITSGAFRIGDVARALWVQRRVERRVASQSFHSTISVLADLLNARASKRSDSARDPARTIRAFEYAKLLRSAADRCLPRSIALALCLATDGTRPNVVIGVKLAPFGAHCWVQQGPEILNDSIEEILRYRPILVL